MRSHYGILPPSESVPSTLPSLLLLWMNSYPKSCPPISPIFLYSFCKFPLYLPHYQELILLIFLYKGRQLAPTSSATTIILSLLDRTYNPVLFSPIFILNSISFEPTDCSCYTPVIFFFFYRKISSKLLPRTNFSPFIFIEFTPIKLLLIPPH